MSYKKPEVRGLGHHLKAARYMTVGTMRRDGWVISTRCPRCHLDCWVDLNTLVRLNGSELKLWNRTARCRRYSCSGRMVFLATPPGEALGAFWALQDDPDQPRAPGGTDRTA